MSSRKDMEIDDDSVAAYKKKLLQFRITELKDVLTQAGLSKQGKKLDLIDRILALLYDECTPGVLKNNVNGKEGLLAIIDATYRNMQEAVAGNSNSKKHNVSSSSRLRPKEEVDVSYQVERKIQCPCGTDMSGCQLVQCLDSDCNVWQHSRCVIIPEKPMDNISISAQFFCEICRLKRADPFWATMAHPLHSFKLVPSSIPIDGTNPHVNVEKTFKLTRVDKDLLQKPEYAVQAWCMLINDSVPYRIQWPQYANLQVNGIPVRTVSRPGSQQLGANGRDDGQNITAHIIEGFNKISFSFSDARSFCFGVRLVRRRTLEQVFGMIPKESEGESFENALARVQRCIGGGIAKGNDGSDSDLEVIADSVSVSLRCPMSGSRMKTAGRFRACAHMGCFDLETFVGINERTRKWQCPICLKNHSLEDIIIDPFFNRILNLMITCGEEINEIDLKPDGAWRVKRVREAGDLAKWHKPDGSIEDFSGSGNGQEPVLDMKNDVYQNAVTQFMCQSLNQANDDVDNLDLNIITMSSTTTENGKDEGEPSINQHGDEQVGLSNSTDPEISSGVNQIGDTRVFNEQNSVHDNSYADIIVLSDSEDDDVSLIYPETFPVVGPSNTEGHSASAPAGNLTLFPTDAAEDPDLFGTKTGDSLVPEPPFRPYSLGDSLSEYLDTTPALNDEHISVTCPVHVNDLLTSEATVDPVPHVMNLYEQQKSSSIIHHGNIPVEALSCSSASQDELPVLTGSVYDQWSSLKPVGNGHKSSSNNVEAMHESAVEEDSLIRRTQGDSGSQSASGSCFDLTNNRKRPGGPFSFPRQHRSPRQRIHRAGSLNTL